MNFRDFLSEYFESLFTSELFSISGITFDLTDIILTLLILLLISVPILYLVCLARM